MMMDQKDDLELNIKSECLTSEDMKIVVHHLLTNSKVNESDVYCYHLRK